jgi:uncharacterized Zn finger protein
MSNTDPEALTPADIASLEWLQQIAEHRVRSYGEASAALAEIRARRLYRGTHASFEAYLRERWGIEPSQGDPYETLARVCELTLATLDRDALAADEELIPRLRWLVREATGTIGDLAHRLERRASDIDDEARAQLREDLDVLEDELEAVRALLISPAGWDAQLTRLLEDEVPPLEDHTDPEDL